LGQALSDPLTDADDNASTPLTPEERAALIPSYITLRSELNEVEQIGIDKADEWAFARRRGDVLDEDFLRQLHRRMFGEVWRWAGTFSKESDRNIGVDGWKVGPELRQLLGDVRYWVEHQTYGTDEIAVRFHHRLVWIHPFPNGNGRLSRLAADLLIVQLGGERFTWGRGDLIAIAELRQRYVNALRAADGQVIGPLADFARS
jgi:Fic-DOC domain mobile mystery protein B